MSTDEPLLRLARPDEADAIDALMKAATAASFPGFYDAAQTAASLRFVASVDRTLIEDGTYFVIEADGVLAACGGWSRRDKRYTGSGGSAGGARLLDPGSEPARVRAMFTHPDWTRRGFGTRILTACEEAARAEGFTTLALVATLPGLALYERCGFVVTGQSPVRLLDGTILDCAAMEKPVRLE